MVSLLGNYALHCVSYTLDNSHEWLILSIKKNSSQLTAIFVIHVPLLCDVIVRRTVVATK